MKGELFQFYSPLLPGFKTEPNIKWKDNKYYYTKQF